jgi:hypothetical protein
VCLCDDDNDLEMARACRHAYVPEVSSASMEAIIERHPEHFTVTRGMVGGVDVSSTDSTEAALSMVLELLESQREEIKDDQIASPVEQV